MRSAYCYVCTASSYYTVWPMYCIISRLLARVICCTEVHFQYTQYILCESMIHSVCHTPNCLTLLQPNNKRLCSLALSQHLYNVANLFNLNYEHTHQNEITTSTDCLVFFLLMCLMNRFFIDGMSLFSRFVFEY